MNDLRDGPDEHRSAKCRGDLGQPRQHTIAVRRPFGKPDSGIDNQRWRDAGAVARSIAA